MYDLFWIFAFSAGLFAAGVLLGISLEHHDPDHGSKAMRTRAVRAEAREADLRIRIEQLHAELAHRVVAYPESWLARAHVAGATRPNHHGGHDTRPAAV